MEYKQPIIMSHFPTECEIMINTLGSVIGVHAGPGTIAGKADKPNKMFKASVLRSLL